MRAVRWVVVAFICFASWEPTCVCEEFRGPTLVEHRTALVGFPFNKGRFPGTVFLSSNGARLVYAFYTAADKRLTLCVDGKKIKVPDWVWRVWEDNISPDGTRIALVLEGDRLRRFLLFIDPEGETREEPLGRPDVLIFSPDSKHLAYRLLTPEDTFSIVDGRSTGVYYRMVSAHVFSSDSKRLAFGVADGKGMWYVVCDGKNGRCYDSVSRPAFSRRAPVGLQRAT